jgi:hypothetical protein
MRNTIQLLSLFAILLFSACQSSLSTGPVTDLAKIGARIEMSQNLTDQHDNSVSISLSDDGGRSIANEGIKISVNGIDLDFRQKQELYYTTSTWYATENIPVSPLYKFEITLTNGKSYFLGSVQPIGISREKDIICDEKGSFDKDFMIRWNNLADVNEIMITKGVKLNTSTKLEENLDYEPVITKQIWGGGQYILPKTEFIKPTSVITHLEIKFTALKTGLINTQLVENSMIQISGHLDKTISFEEQNQ